MGLLDVIFGKSSDVNEVLTVNKSRGKSIFDGIKYVSPILYREEINKTGYLLADIYSDDIISFVVDVNDAFCDKDKIYIHVVSDEIRLNASIILTIYKDGNLEWEEQLSDVCKENILLHLEKIIADYKDKPTNEDLYCKKVSSVINGTYVKPEKENKVIPKVENRINIKAVDKLIDSQGKPFIVDENKNIYYPNDHILFNSIKLGHTYNCVIYEYSCMEYIQSAEEVFE